MTRFPTFVFLPGVSILLVATVVCGAGTAFGSDREDATGLRASRQHSEHRGNGFRRDAIDPRAMQRPA